jgi:Domain of unknown function (DUF4440)
MKIPATALALAVAACALPPPSDHPAASLAAAEAAFAAHSVREDMRVAFLANFADDGVFVRRGGWSNSNAFLRDRPAPAILLDWRPVFTEVAGSGELGLSTGPTKVISKANPGSAPSFGQYVSVWRRTGSGPWKVEADLGIGHAEPTLWRDPLVTRMASGSTAASTGGVAEAEVRFSKDCLERGMRSAYAEHGAQELRFYRNDFGPVRGRAAALASGGMSDDKLVWMPERTEVARSADFGYALGRFASAAAPSATLGWYLRVWHREGGEWRIVMDVTNPAPKP